MDAIRKLTRNRNLFFGDVLLIILAYILTVLVIFPLRSAGAAIIRCIPMMLASVVLFTGSFALFRCYWIYWLFSSTMDYVRMMVAGLVASIVSVGLSWIAADILGLYAKANILACILAIIFCLGLRMLVRLMGEVVRKTVSSGQKQKAKDIIIVGAGSLGVTLAQDINRNKNLNYNLLGFADDDERKQNMIICGAKVLGTIKELPSICKDLEPDRIVIAISTVEDKRRAEIVNLCSDLGCKVKILPGLADSLHKKNSLSMVREVEVEDLLARPSVKLDNSAIAKDIEGKTVLVTGGGGSIGSELCRQIAKFSPKKLVVLDIYENNAFDLQNDLAELFPDCDVDVVIASVRDRHRLEQVFDTYHPSLVFHAAAHKHVPLMEDNAMEAVKNNVFGTYNTAWCADKYQAKKFVLVSTDKAVNPTNVMGATKRICEMIIQAMQTVSKTEYMAVRFGNVLNSNGSVIPTFRRQIRRGGPVTVTHPEITRFFMTIPEAAQLVMQAATYAKGGEIFVLDMGEPVKILDLARNVIRLSGLQEGKDIEIKFTGLRPGEKLYEELLMEEEGLTKTSHAKIYIGKPFFHDMEELKKHLAFLQEAVVTEDSDKVKDAVAKVVPTYVRKSQKEQEKAIAETQESDETVQNETVSVGASANA